MSVLVVLVLLQQQQQEMQVLSSTQLGPNAER
jgi:hypothetical protein